MRLAPFVIVLFLPQLAGAEPQIELWEIPGEVRAGLASTDPTAPRGQSRRRAWIAVDESLDIAKVFADTRDALVDANLTILDAHFDGRDGAITVQGGGRGRAMLLLGRYNSAIYLVDRPRLARPRGRCVIVPQREHRVDVTSTGVNQRGDHFRSEIPWRLQTHRSMDFDGDAIVDLSVPSGAPGICPDEVSWDAYVVRGDCGHHIGRYGPGLLSFHAHTEPMRRGLRRIVVSSTVDGRPPQRRNKRGRKIKRSSFLPYKVTTIRTFEARSGRYRQQSVKTNGGTCHHCGRTSCARP